MSDLNLLASFTQGVRDSFERTGQVTDLLSSLTGQLPHGDSPSASLSLGSRQIRVQDRGGLGNPTNQGFCPSFVPYKL